jgi:tetratricopeptide (TPR) repeat protein
LLRRVEIERELDGHHGIVHSLNAVGYVAHVMGDDRQAEAHFEESLAESRAFDYSWGSAVQLNSLGFLALSQGNQDKAQACFLESLELYQDLNDIHLLASNLYGLARIASQQGQPVKAARWLGAIGPTFGYIENFMNFGITHWVHSETYVRDVAAVREQCGETDFSKAWEAGTALGLTGAIQDVLADKSPD